MHCSFASMNSHLLKIACKFSRLGAPRSERRKEERKSNAKTSAMKRLIERTETNKVLLRVFKVKMTSNRDTKMASRQKHAALQWLPSE